MDVTGLVLEADELLLELIELEELLLELTELEDDEITEL
jgi:hypothetical protein